jgi:CBS domain-containing protein
MIIKKKIVSHQFAYLQSFKGRRLEATLAPGDPKPVKADQSVDTWAADVMTKNVITLTPEDSVSQAIKIFKEKKIHHIPIQQGGALTGMLSDRDVMWLNHINMDEKTTIEQFMSDIVLICHEETPLDHVAQVLYREEINGLPVIDRNHHLVGMITHHDLLRWIYERYPNPKN